MHKNVLNGHVCYRAIAEICVVSAFDQLPEVWFLPGFTTLTSCDASLYRISVWLPGWVRNAQAGQEQTPDCLGAQSAAAPRLGAYGRLTHLCSGSFRLGDSPRRWLNAELHPAELEDCFVC